MPKTTKKIQLMTPFGRAGFCALTRPSTKFNADGDYSARLLLDPDPETDALIEELSRLYQEAYDEALAEVRKDKPKQESIKRADPPFRPQEDPDTGEQLPGYQISAKLKSTARDTAGKILFTRKPIVVDSKNNPVVQEVGAGSIIRLSFQVNKFYTALGAGLSLKLVGAQVRNLVPVGVGDPGFDDVDGGFVETESTAGGSAAAPTSAPVANDDAPPADY